MVPMQIGIAENASPQKGFVFLCLFEQAFAYSINIRRYYNSDNNKKIASSVLARLINVAIEFLLGRIYSISLANALPLITILISFLPGSV